MFIGFQRTLAQFQPKTHVLGCCRVFETCQRSSSLQNPYFFGEKDIFLTSWPLVGNEGMNPQYTNVKVDSLIPY